MLQTIRNENDAMRRHVKCRDVNRLEEKLVPFCFWIDDLQHALRFRDGPFTTRIDTQFHHFHRHSCQLLQVITLLTRPASFAQQPAQIVEHASYHRVVLQSSCRGFARSARRLRETRLSDGQGLRFPGFLTVAHTVRRPERKRFLELPRASCDISLNFRLNQVVLHEFTTFRDVKNGRIAKNTVATCASRNSDLLDEDMSHVDILPEMNIAHE